MDISLIACLVGLIVWFLGTHGKTAESWAGELGRLLFFAGLLVTLFTNASLKLL